MTRYALLAGFFALAFCFWSCGGGGGGGGSSPAGSLGGPGGGGGAPPNRGGGEGGGGDGTYGDGRFEVSRGPFGGDRTTVVIDPADPDRAIADSCDYSGIWLTGDRGGHWQRCNPEGAPFLDECTLVSFLPEAGGEPAGILVAITSSHDGTDSFFRVDLADPAKKAAVPLHGAGASRCRLLAADPNPARPGRIAALAYELGRPGEMVEGILLYSADRGDTWVRGYPVGRFEAVLDMAFSHDGKRLLLATGGGMSSADLRLFYEEEGSMAVMNTIYALEYGQAVDPGYKARYGIDTTPRVVAIDPVTMAAAAPSTLLSGVRVEKMALDPAFPGVIWFAADTGLYRSGDDGMTAVEAPTRAEESQSPLPSSLKPAGLTVLPDPDTAAETLFLSLGGGRSRLRGIVKLSYDKDLAAWKAVRVSPGASRSFLDYPRGSVVPAPSNGRVLYAPYCQDSMLVSSDFGAAGTWRVAMEGMTGFNVFGVTEDPAHPDVLLCTGQNLIRRSDSRVADSNWSSVVIQLDQVAANLRGGLLIDPGDGNRWLAAGGAGAAANLNGGVWLTEDGGGAWTRCLGDDGDLLNNPQIFALVQHPLLPDLVVAAGGRWMDQGTPGVWASLSRGDPGSFGRVLSDGEYLAAAADGSAADGGTFVGGVGLLARIAVKDGAVTAESLPWDKGNISVLAVDPPYLYAGTEGGNLLRCPIEEAGGGTSWALVESFPSAVTALAHSPLRPGEFYAGTQGDGVFLSLDGGASFAAFDGGLVSSEREIYCLLVSSVGDRLYAGTLGGLAVRALE